MKLYFRKRVIIGFVLALAVIAVLGVYSFLSMQRLIDTARLFSHASTVINSAQQLLALTVDIETGQRGYLITSDQSYLEPYDSALIKVDAHVNRLIAVTKESPRQQERIEKLRVLIRKKAELAEKAIIARDESFEAAQKIILSGEGKATMDEIRILIADVQAEERAAYRAQNTINADNLVEFQYSFMVLLILPALIMLILVYSINRHFLARQKAEGQLVGALTEISHLNKELEAYTYSVSHDLRAPLRSISGYSQILREDYVDKLDEEGKRVLGVVINNANRMGQLIDDLLDFSRTSRKEMVKSDVNVDEMVRSIVRELTEGKAMNNLSVTIHKLPPVKADATMLRQVWLNLISNAIKYSSRKPEPVVEIGTENTNDNTVFFVRDNGEGFNMEYKDKLFGVFQRLHKSNEFEGTGVGLALVKRIVTRHGGNVWAVAKLGEGATFFFTIPG